MSVAVDAMGADRGPAVVIEGAVQAASEGNIEVILVGREDAVLPQLEKLGNAGGLVTFREATQVVEMGESPSDSLRRKKDSSIRVAFEMVRQGKADAVVSAGNSGATLATAMVVLGRIKGIRPAIAAWMPTLKDPVVMIDVGANVDCKPRHLFQFAVMGSVFWRSITGKETPRIGLLSIGEEDTKGNLQVKKTYDLLESSTLNFLGNVEGRDVFRGDVDVIVCDGFVGNICLKLSEGLAESVMAMLKSEIESSLLATMGYTLARSAFKRFKKKVDYAEYGGAPLLGIKGVGVICHGRSGAKAIKNAVKMADALIQADLPQQLTHAFSSEPAMAVGGTC